MRMAGYLNRMSGTRHPDNYPDQTKVHVTALPPALPPGERVTSREEMKCLPAKTVVGAFGYHPDTGVNTFLCWTKASDRDEWIFPGKIGKHHSGQVWMSQSEQSGLVIVYMRDA